MNSWVLAYDSFDPPGESLREALCTLGNGYLATRGAAPESWADDVHYPGTYLAGGYNRLKTELGGRTIENEDLVNMPNWLLLRFRPEQGDWFNLLSVEILSYRQELDMKQGLLSRHVCFSDKEKRITTVSFRRLTHMSSMHLAAQELTITPENWSGRMQIHSALDGTVINAGVDRYRQLNSKHLKPLRTESFEGNIISLLMQTSQSGIRVAEAARTVVELDGKQLEADGTLLEEPGYIAQEFFVEAAQGRPVRIEKVVTIFSSRDFAVSEPLQDAVETLGQSGGFDELLRGHALEWAHQWARCDMQVPGNERTQMILRLHIFHLLQTVSRNSIGLDTGVPARGWHGEAYRGHIFWDELFIFPFLNLRMPMLTRSLLLYRYRRLDRARLAARQEGLKGALFPWQSGSNGREEAQQFHLNPKSGRWVPDNSHLQRHVNAVIAYNVWQYYEVTGDMEFMATYGLEMILEIARLLAAITSYNSDLDRYEILGIMGPDEYHDRYPDADKPGLDNNAYTNVMTVWVLSTAIKALEMLPPGRRSDLRESIALDAAEIEFWHKITRKMRVVFHDNGIISQFEGYDRLQEFDWEGYRAKYGDIQRLDRILEAEGDSSNRYKASKQADVLMLFYLFSTEELNELFTGMGYEFDPQILPENIAYYEKRSSHGSTLSHIVHSWVLARSDRQRSWATFCKALESDLLDIQGGTTHEGIHLGAMAGSVDIIQRCYTGMEFKKDLICFNPRIPAGLNELTMRIKYRGNLFEAVTTRETMTISSVKSELQTVQVGFCGEVRRLGPGESIVFNVKEPD